MPVTIAEDCFDVDAPVDPDPEDLSDEEYDDLVASGGLTGHTVEGWEADPRFRVVSDDPDRAAEALERAAQRFLRVGTSGREHDTQAAGDDADDHTPTNAFAGRREDVAWISADTKGWLSHEMATTLKRILVKELEAAGVDGRVEADYPADEDF